MQVVWHSAVPQFQSRIWGDMGADDVRGLVDDLADRRFRVASAVSGLFAALASLRRVEEAAEAGDAGLVAGRVRMCRTGPSSGLVRQCVYDGCA
jgi:hypothetical protein